MIDSEKKLLILIAARLGEMKEKYPMAKSFIEDLHYEIIALLS